MEKKLTVAENQIEEIEKNVAQLFLAKGLSFKATNLNPVIRIADQPSVHDGVSYPAQSVTNEAQPRLIHDAHERAKSQYDMVCNDVRPMEQSPLNNRPSLHSSR